MNSKQVRESAPLLGIDQLTAGYGGPPIVRGVSLNILPGKTTALLGPNGAGKTTFMRAICSMIAGTGSVRLRGQEICGRPTEQIARLGISHVPEGRGTFGELTVEENLRVGTFARRSGQGTAEAIARIYSWLPRLADRRTQLAGSLSGGEQQMLAIGRALVAEPEVLLLDEPSFGLAPRIAAEVMRLLRRLQQETNMGILLVEQNVEIALALADSAYVLSGGRVAASGSVEKIRDSAELRAAYMGH